MMQDMQTHSPSSTDKSIPLLWYTLAREGHFWFEWRFRVFLQQIESLGLDKGLSQKGLDIGCGNGLIRRQLHQYTNWSVDGTEVSEEVVQLNDGREGQTFLYDILECHVELKEKYDFIVLFDVLEHVEDTHAFLKAAIYHLQPEGWLFINVPALNQMHGKYDLVVKHLRRYNKKMMKDEVVFNNLRIQDMRYWGFCVLPLLVMRKFLPYNNTSHKNLVIERGCKPPAPWINKWLLRIMQIETTLLNPPPVGISLMTAIEKLHS